MLLQQLICVCTHAHAQKKIQMAWAKKMQKKLLTLIFSKVQRAVRDHNCYDSKAVQIIFKLKLERLQLCLQKQRTQQHTHYQCRWQWTVSREDRYRKGQQCAPKQPQQLEPESSGFVVRIEEAKCVSGRLCCVTILELRQGHVCAKVCDCLKE